MPGMESRRPLPASAPAYAPSLGHSSTMYKSVPTSNIEAHPAVDDDGTSPPGVSGYGVSREWKPIMLRSGPGMLLVLSCAALVGLLEAFDVIARRHRGFDAENKISVRLARYLPTVAVIILGFAWKSLVQDLKLVTPFSAMSSNWTESRKSVLLDYVDPLEPKSVWTAFNYRHWALSLGLFVGLLCGILVPLANSLTYISLYLPVSQQTIVNQNSRFSLPGALSDNNGTLTIPWTYQGSKPYAAVISSRQPNGKNAPWTSDDFAFESFDITPFSKANATISATVQAFNATFECSSMPLRLANTTTSFYLYANQDDLSKAQCQTPFHQVIPAANSNITSDIGFLNVTDCSGDGTDIRMLATVVANPPDWTALYEGHKANTTAVTLLCKPHYFNYEAEIHANGTTGDILDFNISNNAPQSVDISTTLPVILTYLNNPLDENSQSAYVLEKNGPYASFQMPQATFKNYTLYAGNYIASGTSSVDPFFEQLFSSGRTASDYIANPLLFESEMSVLGNTLLTQIVSSFARANVSLPMDGYVTLHESRLLIRAGALRAMQGIVAFMGFIVILCCTILRPQTRLTEDPGNLAAISVILSTSEASIEKKLEKEVMSGTLASKESLDGSQWLLSHSESGHAVIQSANSMEGQLSGAQEEKLRQDVKPEGYQPFAFRLYAMIMLAVAICAVIISLAILLRFSINTGGFVASTSDISAAWSFIPSLIIVLIGYWLASVYGVLQTMTPYLALRKPSGSRTLQSSNHSSILLMPIHAILRFGSIALAVSSIIAVSFPAVKILAAGLYVTTGSTVLHQVQATIDTSITDRLEAMYDEFPEVNGYTDNEARIATQVDSMVKQASEFAEWITIPDFGVLPRAGTLDNLVFSNLTQLTSKYVTQDTVGDTVALRIPAIAVNVTCSAFGPENFAVMVTDETPPSKVNYTIFDFTTKCQTTACNNSVDTVDLGFGSLGNSWVKSGFKGSSIGSSASHRYQGSASVGGLTKLGNLTAFDTPYLLTLGYFPNFNDPLVNKTKISNESTLLVPGMFNTTISPQQVAVVCNKAFWEVDVDVEITRSVKSGIGGTTILPWSISGYDKGSIELKRQYRKATPPWAYPKQSIRSQYNADEDSLINSDTLWPTPPKSTNVYELLAAYQQYQVGNLSGLMDPQQLAAAVEKVWTSYATQMLTELRPHALANASASSTQIMSGMLTSPVIRIKQDTGITIAVCTLLFLMLGGLAYIFVTFPRESLMARPPSSVAAQMSLLAGSELVKQLRQDGVRSVADTGMWRERFRLGWWPGHDAYTGEATWRWGIDVVREQKPSQ